VREPARAAIRGPRNCLAEHSVWVLLARCSPTVAVVRLHGGAHAPAFALNVNLALVGRVEAHAVSVPGARCVALVLLVLEQPAPSARAAAFARQYLGEAAVGARQRCACRVEGVAEHRLRVVARPQARDTARDEDDAAARDKTRASFYLYHPRRSVVAAVGSKAQMLK